mgnify:CR=1 FL=1
MDISQTSYHSSHRSSARVRMFSATGAVTMFCLYTGVLISLLATGYASEWIPVEGIVNIDFEEEVAWGKWYCSGCSGSQSIDAVSGNFSMLSVNRLVTIFCDMI